jgi:hypothetical protein
MPAFTFEKISPGKISSQSVRSPAIDKKPRNVIVQVLDRFVAVRIKRTLRQDELIKARREQRSRD